jgi:type IV secretion system protein VirB4
MSDGLSSIRSISPMPLSAKWPGLDTHPSPLYPENSPPLMHAATGGATPFRLNLHVSDVGHTLIFGPTGAGKSVLLAMIAAQFRRYGQARITVFDKGRSMYALATACGAAHYDLADDDASPGLTPLAAIDTDADAAWAEDWIAVADELQTGVHPSPRQKQEIHRAITLLRQAGTGGRTLTDFLATVQDAEIRAALAPYTIDGALGRLLDARQDELETNPFTIFEIDELMGLGERSLIPVLLDLFWRFERSLDGAPALLLLDEAWIMLGHPVFREKIREWLKVLRKANCAVVLATQSLSDAARSGLLDGDPRELWQPVSERTVNFDAPAYGELQSQGLDQCGVTLLAGKAVGAPFVGLTAGALCLSEVLRLLNGGPLFTIHELDLKTPEARVSVERSVKMAVLNPGFTAAR